MILDTSFLVDMLHGDDELADLVAEIDASGPPKATTITVMELWEGVHLANRTDRERAAVEELLDGLHELTFTRECAKVAGEVRADLRTAGHPIGAPDVQIASIALVHDEPVVTGNVAHFERITGLETIEY